MTVALRERDPAELWELFHSGNLEARKELIARYYPLVLRVTGKMRRALPAHASGDDITSYGTLGLIRAVDNYKTNTGVRFETYAVASIRGLVLDELRSEDWAPRSLRKAQRTVGKATESLESELSRIPTDEEIADRSEMTVAEVRNVRYRVDTSHVKSLDETFVSTDEGEQTDRYSSHAIRQAGPDEEHSVSEIYALATDRIRELPPQEKAILVLYYYCSLKLSQISQILGIPESKVSSLHIKAVIDIREFLAEHMRN